MAKISKHILIQFLFLICTFNLGYCLSIEGIWIPEKIIWKSPDIEELKEIKYSNIAILQFLADGTFKKFTFTVYLHADGINISIPEWGNIFIGKWEMKNNKEIIANYRLVDRIIATGRMVDGRFEEESLPGKNIKKSIKLDIVNKDETKIYFDKEIFIRDDKLTEESVEFISKYKSKY